MVYKLDDDWHAILELAGEVEQELELNSRTWENELSIIPGLRYGVEAGALGDLELGVASPISGIVVDYSNDRRMRLPVNAQSGRLDTS